MQSLWSPPGRDQDLSELGRFADWLARERGLVFASYDAMWDWSVEHLEVFWESIWKFFDVISHTPYSDVLSCVDIEHCEWFEGATLNYAEHALRGAPEQVVVIAHSQTRLTTRLTRAELRDEVARVRAGLVELGVKSGDRVGAYMPNIPETLIAFLATVSLGAVWSVCSPEFGTKSVIDRFLQIEPKVLFFVDAYRYGQKRVDRASEIERIRTELPSVRHHIRVEYEDGNRDGGDSGEWAISWKELTTELRPLEFQAVSFGHPIHVLYSSGTTGLPKAIVHSHGGVLLEHLKTLGLMCDLSSDDTFFWFSSTAWMMWNFLISGLLLGSTIVLFDGNPLWPDKNTLWDLASSNGVTYFGTSAPFLMACRNDGLVPGRDFELSRIRTVGSTAAPLPAEAYRWVYENVGSDLILASSSGGTDLCSGFVGSCPWVPVWEGEISCRYLGAKVEVYNEAGEAIVGSPGEVVLTAPMPSMPIGFWGDASGSRYHDAYFNRFPGVWCHGDWATLTDRGSCIVWGRSDATLNRGGVRLGTADFYSVVESFPQIADSLVLHLQDGRVDTLLLFVKLGDGQQLSDELRESIASKLRRELSPRHVPDKIVPVSEIPRTSTGKRLEVPLKRILSGSAIEQSVNRESLAEAASLDVFLHEAARSLDS